MKASNMYEGESSRFSALHFLSDLFSDSKKSKTLKGTANMLKEQSFGNDNICTSKPSEFLTAIVHELKTPLNAIIGLSDVMNDSVHYQSTPQEMAEYARDINLAAMELNELIHDILDVEQAASGNFSVDLSQKINVADVLKRSVKLNYDYSLARGVSVIIVANDGLEAINLDAKRVKQVLTNLISNAVKYSPRNSEVRIVSQPVVEKGTQFLEISVADQGFGMSKEQVLTAFEKYKTIQNPNSGSVDSFGLGLPIVKQLVELQNGTIKVKSEINKGTEIKLRFPY